VRRLSEYIRACRCDRLDEWSMDAIANDVEQLQRERGELREISDMYEEGIAQLEHGIMSTGVRKSTTTRATGYTGRTQMATGRSTSMMTRGIRCTWRTLTAYYWINALRK
jgi:hypothetical protein